MAKFELGAPVSSVVEGLSIHALGHYEGWLQRLILIQKAHSNRVVVSWLASTVVKALPKEWRGIPIAWVPGAPIADLHFVEHLALELRRNRTELCPYPILKRSFMPSKPQKALRLGDRKQRRMNKIYGLTHQARQKCASSPILLLDDVSTTGATLLGCRRLIEQESSFKVVGAIAIAATPLRSACENSVLT